MPCQDSYPDETPIKLEGTKKKLNKVTNLLCGLCTRLSKTGDYRYITENNELKEWWERHQKIDKKRIEREMEELERKAALKKKKEEEERKKMVALSKLSVEEIKLLGLPLPPRDTELSS